MNESTPNPSSRRLGRGLSALLGGNGPAFSETDQEMNSELRQIPTAQLSPNPFQPRQQFDAEALGELSASIREHGVLQPILVREVEPGSFQVIAGERRWKAAQKAGLTTIPCRVVDVVDKTACEFALEENLKRKDLSDLEKAQAFRDYLNQFGCTIEELAKQLSMNRSTVNNMLRLLELSAPVKNALNAGRISAGHARAILPLAEADQIEIAGRIHAEQLSVRAIEAIVKKMLGREPEIVETAPAEAPAAAPAIVSETKTLSTPVWVPTVTTEDAPGEDVAAVSRSESQAPNVGTPAAAETMAQPARTQGPVEAVPETIPMSKAESHRTPHVDSLESQLRDLLGVKVEIQLQSKESGKIIVPFTNNDEFERVLSMLRRHAA